MGGTLGNGERLGYTVHGDAVNQPARLEQLNKVHGTRNLNSERTRQLAGDGFGLRPIGEVDGVRVLAPETVARAREPHSDGPDRVIVRPMRYGLGFVLPPALAPGCGEASFGHPGAGGSLGFADPEAGVALGYAMNRMQFDVRGDPRSQGLVTALYDCLG